CRYRQGRSGLAEWQRQDQESGGSSSSDCACNRSCEESAQRHQGRRERLRQWARIGCTVTMRGMHPYVVLAALLRPPRRLGGAVLVSGQCAGALMIRTTLGILEESQVRRQSNPYESRHLIPCPRLPCRGGCRRLLGQSVSRARPSRGGRPARLVAQNGQRL